MAVTGTNPVYSKAFIYRNPTTLVEYDRNHTDIAAPNINHINTKWDRPNQPLALGSGVRVNAQGRWLLNPTVHQPVAQFVVINAGSGNVYAGINAAASGLWGVSSGICIEAGASYEFGEPGIQLIRNVWCRSQSERQTVQGYATNQLNWV